MAPLILLAILPLDLIDPAPAPAATANGLRIEATVEERRVGAALVNVSARPIEAMIGYSCSGPEPFEAIVDGATRPFADPPVACTRNASMVARLAPGERKPVPSRTVELDGNAHRVAVRYRLARPADRGTWRGELTSTAIQVPAAARPARSSGLEMEVRAKVGAIRGGGAQVAIEVVHRWHGPTPERFLEGDRGACAGPQDYLLVDGKTVSMVAPVVCDGPSAPISEEIAPGGQWTTHGQIVLPVGRHRLQAVYQIDAAHAAMIDRPDNMIVFRGEARSPAITIDLP
jgi:hypothetical protein